MPSPITVQLRFGLPRLGVVVLLLWMSAFARAELPPAPEGSFSIILLPNTQTYAAGKPDVFHAETQWIVDNLDKERIRFVSRVGEVFPEVREPVHDMLRRSIADADHAPHGSRHARQFGA